jgi:hypothetical protein
MPSNKPEPATFGAGSSASWLHTQFVGEVVDVKAEGRVMAKGGLLEIAKIKSAGISLHFTARVPVAERTARCNGWCSPGLDDALRLAFQVSLDENEVAVKWH